MISNNKDCIIVLCWHGEPFICTDELKRCVLGFNTISDRVLTIRLQCKPVNMTVIQIYAPTSTAEDEEIEHFYEMVQKVVDETPKGDVLHVIGDWNAKVGDEETTGTTGRFGLGERNERGDRLVEFCMAEWLCDHEHVFQVTCKEAVYLEIAG